MAASHLENMSDTPLYRLRGVRKDFQIDEITVTALHDIDLEIPQGAMIALQGPSGSGKSTLLNILGLIEVPTSGELEFCGHPIHTAEDLKLTLFRRDHIGFIFQNFNLVSVLSAVENVEYPLYLMPGLSAREIRERAMRVLTAVGLQDFARHRPSQLSGGQRQRVAIARALIKEPRVVLADEPTANLDSRTAAQIMDLLTKLQHDMGATILIATHDADIASRASHILRLKDGTQVPATFS